MDAIAESLQIQVVPLTAHDLTGMMAIFLTFLGLMLGLLGGGWLSYRKECLNAALKRDMIARGYTAREIVAVLNADKGKEDADDELPDVPPAKSIKQPSRSVG